MPRIDAPTLAEHNARRRAAILDAAVAILGDPEAGELTPAAVAAAAGLARSSVYQYYPSTGALVAAGVEETFLRTISRIEAGVATAGSPAERVRAYVVSALDAAAAGHAPMRLYAMAELPEPCRAGMHELHAQATRPLVEALDDLGVDDPEAVAELVGGVISVGAAQISRGQQPDAVHERVATFVAHATTPRVPAR